MKRKGGGARKEVSSVARGVGVTLGAHVIWIPDPNALKVLQGRERHIIGNGGSILGSIAEFVPEHFGL